MKRQFAMLFSALLLLTGVLQEQQAPVEAAVEVQQESGVDMDRLLDMDELYGWASVPAEGLDGVTGGGDAAPQVVTTLEELTRLAGDDIPRVIVISGKISTNAFGLSVGSNKTIVGIDEKAKISGGFRIANESNIIINNLNIQGTWPYYGVADCVEIKNSHHIWLNHLSIWNSTDGNIDITMGSDYVTVSWCKLWYTNSAKKSHPHRLSCLVGSGTGHDDTDMDKLRVTYHHNWFADALNERMPRVMYGRAHIYNNYYSCEDNNYCIGADCYASILVENNSFDHVNNPHQFCYDTGFPAGIVARGNQYTAVSGKRETGQHSDVSEVVLFERAPYDYWLNDAADVADIVKGYTGSKSDLSDISQVPAKLLQGSIVAGEEQQAVKNEIRELPTQAAVNACNDNPVTYDETTNTYTFHGQNSDGSNAYYTIDNPFKGYDFSEEVDPSEGVPKWQKGASISYWVYVPAEYEEDTEDAAILNFNLENDRQMEQNDMAKYKMCKAYRTEDSSYSMGSVKTYVDETGREYQVLSGYGKNVQYNPDYPAEGCYYATTKGGAHRAYEKGKNSAIASNWVYLNYIGEGYYENYGARFDEEGGENSRIKEAYISGSLSMYASGSVGYRQDNWKGLQMNPYVANYGSVQGTHITNQFYYWGNTVTSCDYGWPAPTMIDRGTWHFVVAVIQNDWIQYYMDGNELDSYGQLHWWDRLITENAAGDSFNYGYGHKLQYRTQAWQGAGYSQGKTLLDFISDERTVLTVGGMGAAAERLGQNTIGTPDGFQVRDIQAYYEAVPWYCIEEDGINLENENPAWNPDQVYGDADGDGVADLKDAQFVLRAALKISDIPKERLEYVDLDFDGELTLTDAQYVLMIALKIFVFLEF